MIRLGGLVGYAFEGPFPLTTWEVPNQAAIYAVVLAGAGGQFQDEAEPGTVVAIGHTDSLAGDGFPWGIAHADCWVHFGGSQGGLAVAVFLRCPSRSMRAQIAAELHRFYEPPCGEDLSRSAGPSPGDNPPGDNPPGGSRVPARPHPPLLPSAAAVEEAPAENPS